MCVLHAWVNRGVRLWPLRKPSRTHATFFFSCRNGPNVNAIIAVPMGYRGRPQWAANAKHRKLKVCECWIFPENFSHEQNAAYSCAKSVQKRYQLFFIFANVCVSFCSEIIYFVKSYLCDRFNWILNYEPRGPRACTILSFYAVPVIIVGIVFIARYRIWTQSEHEHERILYIIIYRSIYSTSSQYAAWVAVCECRRHSP